LNIVDELGFENIDALENKGCFEYPNEQYLSFVALKIIK
jgi:hypothetical protein